MTSNAESNKTISDSQNGNQANRQFVTMHLKLESMTDSRRATKY